MEPIGIHVFPIVDQETERDSVEVRNQYCPMIEKPAAQYESVKMAVYHP